MNLLGKRLLLIVFLLTAISFNNTLQSQAKSLKIGDKYLYWSGESNIQIRYKSIEEVVGDTIIDGVTYAKIRVESANELVFLYQRSDSTKLYHYNTSDASEKLIFDLSWDIGENPKGSLIVRNKNFINYLDTTLQWIGLSTDDFTYGESHIEKIGYFSSSQSDFSTNYFRLLKAAIIEGKVFGDTSFFTNRPPTLPEVSDTTLRVGGPVYRLYLPVFDSDFDPLEYTLLQSPNGLELSADVWDVALIGRINEYGEHRVEILADDGWGGQATLSFIIRLPDPNSKPDQVPYPPYDPLRLYANFPNPFNAGTTFEYYLPERGDVEIRILDINGRTVEKKKYILQEKGEYSYHIDGTNLTSGIYFYQVKTRSEIKTRKCILIK